MNSMSDHLIKQYGRAHSARLSGSSDVFEPPISQNDDFEAKQQTVLIEWINSLLPHLNIQIKASSEELRAYLIDGTVLLQILNKLRPGSATEGGGPDHSASSNSENVKKFLATMDALGIHRFEISDLEKGSMKPVVDCLLTLRVQFPFMGDNFSATSSTTRGGSPSGSISSIGLASPRSIEEKQKVSAESKFQRVLRSPSMSEASTALMHHAGHKFHEVFQLKQGRYADLSAAKISEMMKSNSLDNAPTQSLLSVVNGILDESIERKNGEIPHRVACLLRKVVQEIERRISTQAEHLRTQNNLFKAREEKYQSRISVLEALASGTGEETGIANGQLQQTKTEKSKSNEKKKFEEHEMIKLMKEKLQANLEITTLRQELETANKALQLETSRMDERRKSDEEDVIKLMKDKEQRDCELATLKQELEIAKRAIELQNCETDEKSKLKEEDVLKLLKEKERTDLELSALKRELEVAKKTIEIEKSKVDENSKVMQEDKLQSLKEKERINLEVSILKRELEVAKKTHELERSNMDEKIKLEEENVIKLTKEKEQSNAELLALKQELEKIKRTLELHCLQMETEAKSVKKDLEERLKELGGLLENSRNRVKVLELYSESQKQSWNKKEQIFQSLAEFQLGALQELRLSSESIKLEILKAQKSYSDGFTCLGLKFKTLIDASENYHIILAENQKMFNELQDLKGNIRVYCRIRPLQRGQAGKQTTIEHIGDNGELVVANPSKPVKDGHRLFKFNTVYGPNATQAEVFSDTQPLIRCVLDGYNVCIFAYGQTGSGKTYTMTGPNGATEEEWGVNYRALNDLFSISQNRNGSIMYDIEVQMFEIYNEQLRDLLRNDGSQKRLLGCANSTKYLPITPSTAQHKLPFTLGIKTISQTNGLAVPDASMHPVTSTSDVIQLMEIGFNNRAVGATALNERSSRSHSVVSIHVRGKDLRSGSCSYGNLHLVDLAGSERVDRSEVTGDRLREAQHINKSLSALGDVIFALAQKSSHVPYRNSKLTQLLQTSLGGQAKTLMFVQLNPDIASYSETMSTLKFAERVSGVELGAARSSKEGRDVRELMEQVASLKDTISKKDGEIERLQLLKDLKNVYPGFRSQKQSSKTNSDNELYSEHSDKHSEGDVNQEAEILEYGDGEREDRLSDVSDGGYSAGTEPGLSADEGKKLLDKSERKKALAKVRSLQRLGSTPTGSASSKEPPRTLSSIRKTATVNSPSVRPPRRWQ